MSSSASLPKRGERTMKNAKHLSKTEAAKQMSEMMSRKVSKTVQMKEKRNKGAKRN